VDLTVLGSGTLLPDDRHRSAGHLVEEGGARILLDCGSGTLHGLDREGLEWRGITHVVITHFHTDHTGDLAPLLWAWKHGVGEGSAPTRILLGPPGLHRVLEGLVQAHGDFVLEPGGPLEVVELERRDRWKDPAGGFILETHPTPHTPESVAVRLQGRGGTVGYTGDTGPSRELAAFFRGVDILVAECALPDELATDNHLTPSSVGDLAAEADPGALVLTHFYPQVDTRGLPDLLRARGYMGTVHIGRDGLRLRVPEL
jgi:ribonuclease BN (tRNA processing enzyme)